MFKDYSGEPTQGLSESDFYIGKQIIPSSLKSLVVRLCKIEDNVTRFLVWYLIRFPFKDYTVPIPMLNQRSHQISMITELTSSLWEYRFPALFELRSHARLCTFCTDLWGCKHYLCPCTHCICSCPESPFQGRDF